MNADVERVLMFRGFFLRCACVYVQGLHFLGSIEGPGVVYYNIAEEAEGGGGGD